MMGLIIKLFNFSLLNDSMSKGCLYDAAEAATLELCKAR